MKLIKLLSVLLLLLPLVSAQEGCFLYEESNFFCSELGTQEALEECLSFEECEIQQDFFPEENCNTFDHCKEVLCKSSCEKELLGRCFAGEVPKGEEQEWCSSGCCQFNFFKNNFCQAKENKWLCEIEAKNKDVNQFLFAYPMNELRCTQECSDNLISLQNIAGGLQDVNENVPLKQKQPVQQIIIPGEKVTETKISEKVSNSDYFLVSLAFLLLVFIFFTLIRGNKPKRKLGRIPDDEAESAGTFNFLAPHEEVEKRIEKLKLKRKHKMKEKEHQDFFTNFGLSPVKKEHSHFHKLERVVKRNQKDEIFHSLDHFVDSMKEKEKKIFEKKEIKDSISKLKKMFK